MVTYCGTCGFQCRVPGECTCGEGCPCCIGCDPPTVSSGQPHVPLYWAHERSGRLAAVVQKFLKAERPLDARELSIMQWYVHQWLLSMPRKPGDFAKVQRLSERELRTYLAKDLLEWGIDPL